MKTVNDFIIRNDGDIEIIIQGIIPRSCMVENYYKGKLCDIPEKLRSVEVIEKAWSLGNEMWVLGVPRNSSLREVKA